jgi:hypothetical protein
LLPKKLDTLEADLSTRVSCLTEKEHLLAVFQHLQFCHITCCIHRNIEHKFLVAQWDALKVAWIQLKEAIERFEREDLDNNQASTSRQ